MRNFHLDIITPERSVFSEDISSVVVPTVNGQIGVLAGHEPLFSSLTQGEIKVSIGNKEYFLAIGEGFMEVNKTGVSILVTRAFHAHELNEAEIKKAQIAAREALSKPIQGLDRAAAMAILRRSMLELKVLRRRHTSPYPVS
jgi:F-type H+-transporting ATPase subunit epsilon